MNWGKIFKRKEDDYMNFYMPTYVCQEENAVKNHSSELAAIGKKAFIITGRNSAKLTGALDDVVGALEEKNTEYIIFDRIMENPTIDIVMEAAEIGRAQGVDFVIGIGGGSPMDAAKAIALMVQNRDSNEDVLYKPLDLRALPVIEVATTCGTGSEVTPFSILTRVDKETKQSISHRIYPQMALNDPRYLAKAPSPVITNTAIDALGHMLESYFHTNATEFSRFPAMRGMIKWSDVKNVVAGGEATADDCEKLLVASSYAGMAITHTSTSLPHALSYYLTYHKNVPHGRAVGMFLPGYLGMVAGKYGDEVEKVLTVLGFADIKEFSDFIYGCLGREEINNDDREKMAAQIMENPVKLATVPFEVTERDVEGIVGAIA